MFTLASFWGALGGISVVIAALAALVTIFFARSTVQEARLARRDNHQAHEEEMAERAIALAAELRLQRIKQIEVVAEVLVDLIETARSEYIDPPPRTNPPMPFRATLIPTLLSRLGTALAILHSLEGPELPKAQQLAKQGFSVGTPPMNIVNDGAEALREVEAAACALA